MASHVDFEQLTAEVTCQKCQKLYSSPKLLPCLHAFCKTCLTTQKGQRSKEGLKYIVDCPVCSETTELDKAGLDRLPDAHFKQRMVRLHSLISATENKGHVECDQCHKPDSQANACCSTCGLICPGCHENHRVMRGLSSHAVRPLKRGEHLEPQIEALKSADDVLTMKCEKHNDEVLKMYCKTCKKLICAKCVIDGHKQPNHAVDDVSTAARAKRAEVQQSVSVAKKGCEGFSERLKSAQAAQESFSKQREDMKKLVATSFLLLKEQIEVLEKKFLSEIDSAADSRLATVTDDIEKSFKKAKEASHLVKMGEQALMHTSDLEFLSLKRYMNTRLKEVAPRKVSANEECESSPNPLTIGISGELMQLVRAHILHNLGPSLEASHASGTGIQKAMVGKEATFTVNSLTDVGEPCIEEQVVEVEIMVTRTGEKIVSYLSPCSEVGIYKVTYIPKVKGEHKVAIRIEGNSIKRSPYSVIARGCVGPWRPTLIIDRQEWPWGVACSVEREIYITRHYHHMIAVFNREGKYQRKIGLKGQTPGNLWHPTGVAVDKEGNIYVADGKENGRLQKFSRSGQLIALYTKLKNPQGVLLNKEEDRVYVCDKGHQAIVLLDTNLEEKRVFGELDHFSGSDGFENISGHVVAPYALAEAENGTIYISDTHNVHIFTKTGDHLRKIEHLSGQFAPSGIAIDGDQLYVCDMVKNQLLVFSTEGSYIGTKGSYGKGPGQFNGPTSMAVDYDGYLYVADYSNKRVQVF